MKALNKEQVRYFKLFASRTQQSFERKDIKLFDFLRKNEEDKEEAFLQKLYPGESKNAWYRLRNRLLSD